MPEDSTKVCERCASSGCEQTVELPPPIGSVVYRTTQPNGTVLYFCSYACQQKTEGKMKPPTLMFIPAACPVCKETRRWGHPCSNIACREKLAQHIAEFDAGIPDCGYDPEAASAASS